MQHEVIQLFSLNIFQVSFFLPMQLYCSRLTIHANQRPLHWTVTCNPFAPICPWNFTTTITILQRVQNCSIARVQGYVYMHATILLSSDILRYNSVKGYHVTHSFDFTTDSNVNGFEFETRNETLF